MVPVMAMTAAVMRADARDLPLPDGSVDLIVTSPPYFGLRSYTDGGEHYAGQIGSEATPGEWVAALVACTREWARVLKPSGSIFVNLGDKYSGDPTPGGAESSGLCSRGGRNPQLTAPRQPRRKQAIGRPKSLLGLPWRYALACTGGGSQLANPRIVKALMRDYAEGRMTLTEAEAMVDYLATTPDAGLGLILRRDIIWSKPNGLPESVTDRCRSSHEYLFHLVKQPRYFSAVDEIREPHQPQSIARTRRQYNAGDSFSVGTPNTLDPAQFCNPLGKLPGSVWDIPSQPLRMPACRLVWDGRTVRWFMTWEEGFAHMRRLARDRWAWRGHHGRPSLRSEIDHFAAFPMELPRRCILGWSPAGVCTACGEGRRPVVVRGPQPPEPTHRQANRLAPGQAGNGTIGFRNSKLSGQEWNAFRAANPDTITGYACACPTTSTGACRGCAETDCGFVCQADLGGECVVQPLPPTRPAVVLDPFGGTGTTALVASVLGRDAISVDLSHDYGRSARWRTTDRGERARAMQVPKPPPIPDGQEALFELLPEPPDVEPSAPPARNRRT